MEQGVQTEATCNHQQCWELFANNVASVYTGLYTMCREEKATYFLRIDWLFEDLCQFRHFFYLACIQFLLKRFFNASLCSKHLNFCRNVSGLLGCMQTDATTPNIVAPTMLFVVASVLAVVCKQMQQLPTMLGPAVHRAKDTTHTSL